MKRNIKTAFSLLERMVGAGWIQAMVMFAGADKILNRYFKVDAGI